MIRFSARNIQEWSGRPQARVGRDVTSCPRRAFAVTITPMNRRCPIDPRLLAGVLLLVLAGCASHGPAPSHVRAAGSRRGEDMVGVKYRYGGASPKGIRLQRTCVLRLSARRPDDSAQLHRADARRPKPIELKPPSAGRSAVFRHVLEPPPRRRSISADGASCTRRRRARTVSIESLDDGYFCQAFERCRPVRLRQVRLNQRASPATIHE